MFQPSEGSSFRSSPRICEQTTHTSSRPCTSNHCMDCCSAMTRRGRSWWKSGTRQIPAVSLVRLKLDPPQRLVNPRYPCNLKFEASSHPRKYSTTVLCTLPSLSPFVSCFFLTSISTLLRHLSATFIWFSLKGFTFISLLLLPASSKLLSTNPILSTSNSQVTITTETAQKQVSAKSNNIHSILQRSVISFIPSTESPVKITQLCYQTHYSLTELSLNNFCESHIFPRRICISSMSKA